MIPSRGYAWTLIIENNVENKINLIILFFTIITS
jgi:hypothetical protein